MASSPQNFHSQIQSMFSGAGNSATSTTSLGSVFESLASDTRGMLDMASKHYSRIEKILLDQTKAIKRIDGFTWGDALMMRAFSAVFKRLGMGALGTVFTGMGAWFAKTKLGNFIDKAFAGTKTSIGTFIRNGTNALTGQFKSLFGTFFNPVKAAGVKIVGMLRNAMSVFSTGGLAKMFANITKMSTSVFSSLGKIGGVAGKALVFLPRLLTKLAWPLTAIMGLYDAFQGWNNAEDILGHKPTGVRDKVVSAIGSAVNGMLLGIPDWIAKKLGAANYTQALEKSVNFFMYPFDMTVKFLTQGFTYVGGLVKSAFLSIKEKIPSPADIMAMLPDVGAMVYDTFWSVYDTVKNSMIELGSAIGDAVYNFFGDMKKSVSDWIFGTDTGGPKKPSGWIDKNRAANSRAKQSSVESTIIDKTGKRAPNPAFVERKSGWDSGRDRTNQGAWGRVKKAPDQVPIEEKKTGGWWSGSPDRSNQGAWGAVKVAPVTSTVVQAAAIAENTKNVVDNQLPSAMKPYFAFITNALQSAAASMVAIYGKLQEQKLQEELEAQEDIEKEKMTKWERFQRWSMGLTSSITGTSQMGTNSSNNGTNSSYNGTNSNSTSSNPASTAFTPTAENSSFIAKQSDGTYKVGDKTIAADSKQARNYNFMDKVDKKRNESEWSNDLPEEKKVGILKRELKKKFPEWTDNQITGSIANLKAEGLLNTNQQELGKSRGQGGYGLMQWTGSRRRQLEQYARDNGRDIDSLDLQLDFMRAERDGTVGTEKQYYANWENSTKNIGVEGAAKGWESIIERPGVRSTGKRVAFAQQYDKMAAADPSNPRWAVPEGKAGQGLGSIVSKKNADAVAAEYYKKRNGTNANPVDGSEVSNVVENQAQVAGIRKADIIPDLKANISEAVYRTLGPDYEAQVYSGGQDESTGKTGSRRHNYGFAADSKIINKKTGQQITQEEYAKVAQLYTAENMGSIGLQMNGGGMHMDAYKRNQEKGSKYALMGRETQYWNYNKLGGVPVDPKNEAMVRAGIAGQMPEGVRSKEDFQKWIKGNQNVETKVGESHSHLHEKNDSTPTSSFGGLSPDDRDAKSKAKRTMPSWDSLTNKPVIASGLKTPEEKMWPEPKKDTVPAQATGDKTNAAKTIVAATNTTNNNNLTAPKSNVRVSDIPPIDEYKMTMVNGSATV